MAEPAPVLTGLERWAREEYGAGALIEDVRPMAGHSGYSFGFTLRHSGGTDELVIRLPPPGSKQRGSSDVLHQATVMAAMGSVGVPVPEVRHAGDGERWFGTPYVVVTRMPGRSTSLFREGTGVDGGVREDGSGMRSVFTSAMETLASIHAVDWQALLTGWTRPTSLEHEIASWQPTLAKTRNSDWLEQGRDLAALLLERKPPEPPYAVVHGDYYSNNWLFADGRITAVVDWEISGIGAPGLDLGWVAMFYDQEAWGPSRHFWEAWLPDPAQLIKDYANAGGRPEHVAWYRALANYRFGCITARAYELHLSRKHVDPAWEINAEALPHMFRQARRLLLASRPSPRASRG